MKHANTAWLLGGLIAISAAAHAADMPEREMGLLIGGGWAYEDSDLVGTKYNEFNPLFGLRYGQRFNEDFNVFGDFTYVRYDGDSVGDADVGTLRFGLEWLFSQQPSHNWFLSGGFGLMAVNTDFTPDFTRPMGSVGIGQAWEVGVNDSLRWEVRYDQSFGNSALPNEGLTNIQALLGYSWGLGAPLDSDGDGVSNRLDQCPGTPKGAKVDTNGCPLDTDGDGVFDGLDKCEGTPAGVKVSANGCPLDSDGDGIPDYKDRCPTVSAPGTADGCPLDSDGDGIPDYKDRCPTVSAPGTVDGCPLDSDGDGIPDYRDACPTVPAPGTDDGCPPKVVEPEAPKPMRLNGVNFDFDKSDLRPETPEVLDSAATTIKQWGDTKVEVAGHTDSVGTEEYNLELSQRRAEAVRAYLVDKEVPADRLTAKGYGESMPEADNATEEGRARNRRVELIPQQ
jgi:OOP family OmpA-OmpF porin